MLATNTYHLNARMMSCQDAHFSKRRFESLRNNLAHAIVGVISARGLLHSDYEDITFFFNLFSFRAWGDEYFNVGHFLFRVL